MAVRFRYWTLSFLFSVTIGLVVMLLVTLAVEPLAVHLARAAGSHPTAPILTPALVAELAQYSGIAAFLGCLGLAIEAA